MKIFITGATGFIGTYLVKRLTQTTENELVCLARKTSDVRKLEEQGVTLINGDVTDIYSLLEGMRGCQWVINLANLYSFWEPKKQIFSDVNVNGTRNVMECALKTGISKVVHISTAGIYGKPMDCPFCEESQVGPARFSEYFRTKYKGDLIAWELYEKKGLPLVMVYPVAAANELYIDNVEEVQNLTVFDITGAAVMGLVNSGQTKLTIDISSLSSGLYMVRMTSNEATGVVRFIKK